MRKGMMKACALVLAVLSCVCSLSCRRREAFEAEFEKAILELQKDFRRSEQPWRGTKTCETLPFSVEYRHAHPFLAEYDKRILFKSGKRVGILNDTGGAGDFAVYALRDGRIYLIDGLDCPFIRSEYRVDSVAESVEKKCVGTWIRIPDGSLGITSWSDFDLTVETADGDRMIKGGVPVGESLTGKRYLGRITPRGELIIGGPEPETKEETRGDGGCER